MCRRAQQYCCVRPCKHWARRHSRPKLVFQISNQEPYQQCRATRTAAPSCATRDNRHRSTTSCCRKACAERIVGPIMAHHLSKHVHSLHTHDARSLQSGDRLQKKELLANVSACCLISGMLTRVLATRCQATMGGLATTTKTELRTVAGKLHADCAISLQRSQCSHTCWDPVRYPTSSDERTQGHCGAVSHLT